MPGKLKLCVLIAALNLILKNETFKISSLFFQFATQRAAPAFFPGSTRPMAKRTTGVMTMVDFGAQYNTLEVG